MSNVVRVAVAAVAFSASYFVTTLADEYFTEDATIPVVGDRPTYGFGSTFRPDGKPVKLGDRIKPAEAVALSYSHISKDEIRLKQCVTGNVSQLEWNLLVDHAYQYGAGVTCSSSMVANINQGKYREACEAYTEYRKIHKGKPNEYDCSTMINGKRNKVCWGVWERSKKRRDSCLLGL